MTIKTQRNRWGIVVLIFLLAAAMVLPAAAETYWNDVIDRVYITTLAGNDPPAGGLPAHQFQEFRINVDFTLTQNVQAGDKTVLKLPNTLEFSADYDFEIKSGGNLVANAHVDKASKTVTLTYTAFPSTQASTTGSFYFSARVDGTQVPAPGAVPIVITMEDGTEITDGTINYQGPKPPPPAKTFRKRGWMSGDGPQILNHYLNINETGIVINNAVVTDELQEKNVTYIRDSIRLRKGEWTTLGADWVLKPGYSETVPSVTYGLTADGRETFTIDIGNIAANEGYQIFYQTKVSYYPANGEKFKNKAKLTGDGGVVEDQNLIINVQTGGGMAQGYVCSIKVEKFDETTNAGLANVEFRVTRKVNGQEVGIITTGADGTGTLGGLLYDKYIIEEITPPYGYLPIAPIEVTAEEFGAGFALFKRISNKPNEKISIPVTKIWEGPKKEAIVQLFADDTEAERKTLNADNHWQHTFSDLWKYSPQDGHLIKYEIKELPLDDYNTVIEPNNPADITAGVVITNKNTETVYIPVQKRWEGPVGGEVTVRLQADGVPVPGQTLTLKAPDWQGSFYDLPKYKTDGTEILYSVTETEVSGVDLSKYIVQVVSGEEEGFLIINTNKEKIEIPVRKVWDGPVAGSVRVHLKAKGSDDIVQTVELNEDNGWQNKFTDLDKYAEDGTEIEYTTVEEANPPAGYHVTVVGNATDGFTVTNKFVKGEWTPSATKKLTGRALADDEFEFELKEGTNVLQTVKNKADGSIPFTAIQYTLAGVGEHTYTITEKPGTLGGVTYDNLTVTYVVTVSDNGDGTLKAEITGTPLDTRFDNVYTATGSWTPVATKKLTGRELEAGEFAFELKEGENLLQSVSNNADGTIPFAPVEYTLADVGEHTYTLSEKRGSLHGVSYDSMKITYVVTVSDNGDGTLTATATSPADTEFNNRFSYDPVKVPLSASKTFVNGKMKAGDFAFELLSSKGKVLETVKNDENGRVRFTDRRFSRPGTFEYTIREVKGDRKTVHYDETVYRVIVRVSAFGSELSVKVEYQKDGQPYTDEMKFVNSRKTPQTGDSGFGVPIYLAILSLAVMGGAILIGRKRKHN